MIDQRLFFLFSFLFACQLNAQQLAQKNFDHYTTANGLSHNHVTGLMQDTTGYVWISTLSGFNRFNGSQFVQFHSSNSSLSPASEVHAGINWLNKPQLGFYNSGLHIVNTKTGSSRNLFVPYYRRQYQYKFNMVEKAMGDADGSIYILTRSGFYHFDKKDSLLFRFDYYSEADVPSAHFFFGREILWLDEARLLIVSVNGLYIYNKKEKKVNKMEAGDCPLLDEFFDYATSYYIFFQHKPGKIFVLKSLSDSIVYIDIAKNKKVYSPTPFKPLMNELHYRSRLLPVNDSVFYVTGHNTGFYKMELNCTTGKIKFHSEKFFSNYQCTALLYDSKSKLWVGTNKGLFHYNESRSRIQVAAMPQTVEDAFPNIVFSKVFVTANKLYAGTYNFGNLLVYNKSILEFTSNESFGAFREKTGKSVNVYSIIQAAPSTLMLATNGPLMLLNTQTAKWQFLSPPTWKDDRDWAGELFKDSKDNIWVSSGKIYLYNHVKKQFDFIPQEVLEQQQIRQPETIREDTEGNIWMAGHGLSRYNTKLQRFDLRIDSFPFIKMPDKQVSAMVIDKKRSEIWFNSKDNGLVSYNINTGRFRHFTTANNLPNNNIASLFILNDKLWIAGLSGLACMELSDCTITGFGKEDGFPDMPIINRSNFFYDSSAQQLYIGFSKAIVRFNPAALLQKKSSPHVFIESIAINEQPTYLPPQKITTSWKETEIKITIGTINFSDAGSQRFAYRILKRDSTAWIETGTQASFSISNLSPGTHTIQVKCFSATNRWPGQVRELQLVVLPPLWQKSWFIFMATAIVLALIYILIGWRTNLARRKEMIKTQIEKLKADDYKAQFELEQITNYFSSSLADKKTEEEVLWDVSRNLIGRMNYEDCIIYLWNGDKTKMLQKAAYGPKGKPEVISANIFEVLPGQGIVGHVIESGQPLLIHDTRKDSRYRVDDEFRLSELCVPIIHNNELLGVIDSEHHQPHYFSERDIKILTTIATLLGNKLKQIESEQTLEAKQKELAGINEQLAEARLAALQAQMNPHFVFNALNSIKRMILDADNDKASRYLSKFALMIRMTLEHSKEIFVTLDENIEYIKAYLQMEQLRFDDSFTYHLSVDENLDTAEVLIPSMMIQPLVENAIWHGLMHTEGEKKIRLAFCQCQNKITCTVEDNGIGIRQSEAFREAHRPLHRSVGLQNLQNRIKIMNEKYNLDCSLQLTDLKDSDKNGSGTRVVLQFNSINI